MQAERDTLGDTSYGEGAFSEAWCLLVSSDGLTEERLSESLLCLADGVVGTRGALEDRGELEIPAVAVSDVYVPDGAVGERLLELEPWFLLPLTHPLPPGTRMLDLRDGVLRRWVGERPSLLTVRFACAARPGVSVLLAELASELLATEASRELVAGRSEKQHRGSHGGVACATAGSVRERGDRVELERVSANVVSPRRLPGLLEASRRLEAAQRTGGKKLLEEQRRTWRRRWAEGDVEVLGSPELTRAARFALFHLRSSVRRSDEAAVGARGLTGPAYAGHVFWDSDVFVLPVLAAVDPRAARCLLEYRLQRLPPARARARREGRRGARFPWESAGSGEEVTPQYGINHEGARVPIRNGELEEHITADVAWSAWRYAAWTGDWSFLAGEGRPLLLETARYWASRIELDGAGQGHIGPVIGPDEYHVAVTDNAYTNLMARWNLSRAADLLERSGGSSALAAEAESWRMLARALVDNLEPETGRYEQFSGYDRLQPRLVAELGRPPLPADLLLGPEVLESTQLIKQADVLMAHFLLGDALPKGSLEANLDFYLARCAHGSSLSPGVHATLLARAGRPGEALELLRLAIDIDFEDLTETSAEGLHLANLAAIWLAMVHGFAGLVVESPADQALEIRPSLPDSWEGVRLRLRWHGQRIGLTCRRDSVEVECSGPLDLSFFGRRSRLAAPGGIVR